jgi:hypothetical protein
MADDSKLSNVGGNGFIWILLVVAGTIFASNTVPLSGSRPASTERSVPERVGEQHVDARLWQDPFAAVADVLAKSPELKPENCYRRDGGYKDIETYCRPPWEGSSGLPDLMLVASVSGTPYSEDQEARRRRRYAVLAALDAEGFVPADAQHIGFYWPEPQPPPQEPLMVRMVATSVDSLRANVLAASGTIAGELPKVVPYEWFTPRPERPRRRDDTGRYQRILLLWFDEDILAAPAKPPPEAISTAPTAPTQERPARSSPRPIPLQQYTKLLCPYLLASQKEGFGKVNILGPQLSTTLKAMVDEVDHSDASQKDWSSGACPRSDAPSFYVSQATVSDATLLPERSVDPSCSASITCLSKFFADKRGIKLYRLTPTDDALARAIGDELTRRGIDSAGPISRWYERFKALVLRAVGEQRDFHPAVRQEGHGHIVLISEWDTLYGRALPDAMARCLGRSSCETVGSDPFSSNDWLHPFKYVRGLDGQMPDGGLGAGTAGKDGGSKPDKNGKDSTKPWSDPSMKARAEGQSQFDYLQRLGDRIKQLDTELRLSGQHGIAAVGVLGSDLYDKLLVLQALRPLLPDAWFFTTDLDALLLHPSAQSATRNLLVASGFGLQLRPDVQGAIPPFRSNYQTSEFLAARVATHKGGAPNPCWSSSPLLFEIGSSHEFQFAETALPDTQECKDALLDCDRDLAPGRPPGACRAALREGQRTDHEACRKDMMNCGLIHPIATAMLPQLSRHSWQTLVAVGLLVGFALVLIPLIVRMRGQRARDGIDVLSSAANDGRPLFTLSTWAVVALGLAIILGIALAAAAPLGAWLTQGGQPMLLLEGISLWPTIFLRLATLLLCIWLLLYSLDHLDANMRQIEHDLHLDEPRDAMRAVWPALLAEGPLWIRLLRFFGYQLPDTAGNDVWTFWCKYFYQGRPVARFCRVAAGVAVVLLLWGFLVLIFGNPHAPARGETSASFYHSITFVLFVFTLALIFFVADATWLCWRLTRDIRTPTVLWPTRTLQEFSRRYHLSEGALADCIDLMFVARRSKCINTLLYGPFLIIALIVVSHSQLLAQYGRSIPALVTVGVAVLIVIGCAVALRVSAEATRAEARRRLNERLVRAKGGSNDALASQLELVMLRIEEMREGAFSPFSQQPVVRAMLLPLGGLGGTALLNYLLVPGIG